MFYTLKSGDTLLVNNSGWACIGITNLVPSDLRHFVEQLVARRDSGEFEKRNFFFFFFFFLGGGGGGGAAQ